MGEVTLSAEQFEEMATAITNNIVDIQSKQTPPADTPPADTPALSAASVAAEVMAQIQASQDTEEGKVFKTLWNDKFNSAVNDVPGLGEFIDGEDDYGNVRKDQLDKIPKYEDRVEALGKLAKSFNEASAGQKGRKPIINTKVQKQVDEAEASYAAIEKKMSEGAYTSEQELANDWFAAMGKETAPLM